MPGFDLNRIFGRLRDRVRRDQLSPINQRPTITKFDNSTKSTPRKNKLGLPSILRPIKDFPQIPLSDRPLPTIKEEYVSEEFTTKPAEEVQDSFDILDSAVDFTLNVIDEVFIETPDIRNIKYPKEIRGGDFIGFDVDFEILFDSTESTSYVDVGIGRVKKALRKTPDGKVRKQVNDSLGRSGSSTQLYRQRRFAKPVETNNTFVLKFNVKELLINYLDLEGTEDLDIIKIPFNLTPINANTRKPVEGKTETFTIVFDKGDLEIPRSVAVNRIVEAFKSQLDINTFENSKYLTHLAHFGDGNNKLISNWIGLKENPEARDGDSSLIIKLYEPLPADIQPNQKLWISKLQSEPIIETITLVGDDMKKCPPLQGPNFSLEVSNGIGYQIYDDLLASGSGTSTDLLNEYTNTNQIDTKKLSIQYASGSNHTFENFVRFGSAEERIKNFQYKVELLENYQESLSELTEVQVEVSILETEDGRVILTEGNSTLSIDALSITQQSVQQANKITDSINNLIRSFDGFETFLYTTPEDRGGYPKTENTLLASNSNEVQEWYNTKLTLSANYDKNNVNYLINNVPEYLREDYENEEYMLFLDMIGQHFDVIWTYINAISNSKKLESKLLNGIPDTLVSHMLKSLGWDTNRAYDSQYLWEYALGQYKDGTQKYDRSLKDANEEIWRRILNNLPYLLKHKGTKRSLKAILATYGIPQSLLTIMEFGGPKDPTQGGSTSFTFEDRTAAIKLSGSQYIEVNFINDAESEVGTIEMNLKFDQRGNHGLLYLTDNSDTYFKLEANQTTGSRGKLKFSISASADVQELESSEVQLFNDTYKHIALTRTLDGGNETFNLYLNEAKGDRLRINDVNTLIVTSSTSWDSADILKVGGNGTNGLTGSIDEFRLWSTPLNSSVISNHTKIPDAINGNHYSASSTELLLRHDFEYPKNRHTSGDTQIINVAITDSYVDGNSDPITSSLAVNFTSESAYPYNYESYERSVTAQVPSMGFSVADKIRFENQTLVGNLSHKTRATKKSFDQAPVDSPKLGLFFSPTKELNMDILKSMGNFNIDNYIGDPRDEYNDEYSELNTLREYYFERVNLNVQEYIQLVRNIDKSLFDTLSDLVPARAKVAKGLLIEPHILERSKQKWERPESERRDYDTEISIDDNNSIELTYDVHDGLLNIDDGVTFDPSYNTYNGEFNANDAINVDSDYNSYQGLITASDDISANGEYPTYESIITAPLGEELDGLVDLSDFIQVGINDKGFGLFASASHAKVTTIDILGNITSSRQQIYDVDIQFTEKILTQTEGWPATTNNKQVKYEYVNVTKTREDVTKIPFGGSAPSVSGNTVSVEPLNGYLPSHYKFVKNHSLGFERSFFRGSQQTAATTPDGLSPVETITTNPNILKVADTGRGSGEPILEVD
jgi:hypothetical protein